MKKGGLIDIVFSYYSPVLKPVVALLASVMLQRALCQFRVELSL